MIQCSKCYEEKANDNFYPHSKVCKPCRNKQLRAARQKNIAHYKAKWKEYEQRRKQKQVSMINVQSLTYAQLWKECGYNKRRFTEAYKRKNKIGAWASRKV